MVPQVVSSMVECSSTLYFEAVAPQLSVVVYSLLPRPCMMQSWQRTWNKPIPHGMRPCLVCVVTTNIVQFRGGNDVVITNAGCRVAGLMQMTSLKITEHSKRVSLESCKWMAYNWQEMAVLAACLLNKCLQVLLHVPCCCNLPWMPHQSINGMDSEKENSFSCAACATLAGTPSARCDQDIGWDIPAHADMLVISVSTTMNCPDNAVVTVAMISHSCWHVVLYFGISNYAAWDITVVVHRAQANQCLQGTYGCIGITT